MSWRLPILLVAALALRLAIAPLPSYWVDEAFTVQLLGGSLGDVFSGLADTESTPPLYYALAWVWTQATGLGELGLRSLSALAGAATVACAWALGRWLAGPRAALAAGALAAVNPLLIWFSTEARAYSLAALLATAALVALVGLLARDLDADGEATADDDDGAADDALGALSPRRPIERAERRRLTVWAALAASALLTHYATVFVVVAQAAVLLHRRASRAAWVAIAAVGAVGAALLPLAIAQRGNDYAQSLETIGGGIAKRVAQLPKQFAIGYDAPAEAVTGAIAIAVLVLGIALAVLAGPLLRERCSPGLRERAPILLTVAAAGLLAPIALSVTGLDLVSSRYLLPALPALLAVAGAGLATGPWRRLGPALAIALTAGWLAAAVVVAADPRLQTRADWQGVADVLGPTPAGGRAIVTSPSNGALVLADGYHLQARFAPPRPVVEIVVAATGAGRAAPPHPPTAAPAFAAAGFRLVEQRRERGYVLQRWRARAPVAVDPAQIDQATLDPTGSSAVLWQP